MLVEGGGGVGGGSGSFPIQSNEKCMSVYCAKKCLKNIY